MNRLSLPKVKDNEVDRVLRQIEESINALGGNASSAESTVLMIGGVVTQVAAPSLKKADASGVPLGGTFYTHTQGYPSSAWVVTHNLGYNPSVTVVDSSGSVVIGDVTFETENTLTIRFSGAFSGHAYFS